MGKTRHFRNETFQAICCKYTDKQKQQPTLCFTFNILKGMTNTNLLCAPFVRTSFGSRSFSVAAPEIWNSLPPAIRMCTSHDTFRHQLKTHYFQLAFQPT